MTHKLPPEYGVEILRAEVGSTLHGISIGNDDIDQMGVCIEDPRYVIGLEHFEQYIFRTAATGFAHQVPPAQEVSGLHKKSSFEGIASLMWETRGATSRTLRTARPVARPRQRPLRSA